MNWDQVYNEKYDQFFRAWSFNHVVNIRIRRFKSSFSVKAEHVSELEYLILNYDDKKSLLKRYQHVLSEDVKDLWLEKQLINHPKHAVSQVLLPFYLINPETENAKIDKQFLHDQLLIHLSALDHRFKKHRWRAHYLLEFLTPAFSKLPAGLRTRIIELLSSKTNAENIFLIKILVIKNQDCIGIDLVNRYVQHQIDKELISPQMAIGMLKKIQFLDRVNIDRLKEKTSQLKDGK